MMRALVLARRDLRGGVRGLIGVVLCLALGVGAIAAVGSLRASVTAGLAAQGRRLLGGDVAIGTGAVAPPAVLRTFLAARGARMVGQVGLRSLLVAPEGARDHGLPEGARDHGLPEGARDHGLPGGARQLVSVRAVGPAWPLIGQARIAPDQSVAAALARRGGSFGLLADPLVLARLGLRPGMTARLGTETFIVRGALIAAPDQLASPAIFGAPVLIARAALAGTGLDVPGALVTHQLNALLARAGDGPALRAALRARFAAQGWRIRGPDQAAPGADRFVTLTSRFMALVGLTALLMGGIGVANGVSAWLDGRSATIATLRCLGAPARLVLAMCLIEVGVLAALGIGLGIAAGAAVPLAAGRWLAGVLPLPLARGVYAAPLALAALYGALTAGAFALWPLGRAARIPGAALFRGAVLGGAAAGPRPALGVIAANVAIGAALLALAVGATADRRLALWFCAAALGALVVFRGGSWVLARAVAALPAPRSAWARVGLGNLYRPGAATGRMLVSVGLGLATLAAVALVQGGLQREVLAALPDRAPSFFFIDILPAQVARFTGLVRAVPGMTDLRLVPTLRARIVAVNGVPAAQVHAAPGTGWALRGDRGLTYAASPPPGTRLVAGRWWAADYQGPPLVSLDARLARGWGVGIGGVIRVNVVGRDIDLRIASLRDISWQRLGINFVLVASPGLLSGAPSTDIATLRVPKAGEGALLARVTDALPNVTGIAVREVLAQLGGLLDQIAAALAATGAVTVAAGALVLAGAVAAGQRRRIRQAVLLRTLGATRAQIRAAWITEFGVLGLAAGVLAALVGAGAAWGVLRGLMGVPFVLLPARLAGGILVALAMALGFGYAGTARALRTRPAALLRDE